MWRRSIIDKNLLFLLRLHLLSLHTAVTPQLLKMHREHGAPNPPTPPSPPQEHIAAGRGSRPHYFPSCLVENLQKGVKCCALPYKRYTVLVQKITDLVGGPLLQTKVLVKNMQSKTSIGIFVQEEVRGVAQRQRSPHHFFPECFFLRSHRSTQMQIGRKWPKWLLSPNKSSQ